MTSTFNITKICNVVFPGNGISRSEMTSTIKQNQTRLLKQYSDFSLESSKLEHKYSKEAVLIKYIIHLETELKRKEDMIEDMADTYQIDPDEIEDWTKEIGFTKPKVNDISIKLDKIDDSISIKLDKVLQIANHRLKLWYINNNEKKVVEPKGPPRVDNSIKIEDIVKKSLCIPEILEYDYSEIDCMDNITYIEEDRQHVFDEFKMIYGGRSGRLSRMNRPIKESACIIIQKYVRRKLVQESNLLSPHQRKRIGDVINIEGEFEFECECELVKYQLEHNITENSEYYKHPTVIGCQYCKDEEEETEDLNIKKEGILINELTKQGYTSKMIVCEDPNRMTGHNSAKDFKYKICIHYKEEDETKVLYADDGIMKEFGYIFKDNDVEGQYLINSELYDDRHYVYTFELQQEGRRTFWENIQREDMDEFIFADKPSREQKINAPMRTKERAVKQTKDIISLFH